MISPCVFARLDKFNAARIIRVDLKAAGIPYTDESGNVFDFHALRHQFISNLAAAGVHPKTAQELARHSDIKLTLNRYTHVFRGELDKAVDALPDYAAEQARQSTEAVKTGTHDIPVEQTHEPMEDSPFNVSRNGALLCTEPKRSVAPSSVKADIAVQSQSQVESSESHDNHGNSDGIRRCSSMAEQRFCKPHAQDSKPLNLADNIDAGKRRAENALKADGISALNPDENLAAIIACWDRLDVDVQISLRLKAEALSCELAICA